MTNMKGIYKQRIVKLQAEMIAKKMDTFYCFHYTEISYFCGCHLGNILMIPSNGTPTLMTRQAITRIHLLLDDCEIVPFRSFKDLEPYISRDQRITIPKTVVPFGIVQKFCSHFAYDPIDILDGQLLINAVTPIKSQEEIRFVQQAGEDITDILMNLLRKDVLGKTEIEISGMLYAQLRAKGFIGEYQFRNTTPFVGPGVLTGDSILQPSSTSTTYSGFGAFSSLATGSGNHIIEEGKPFVIDIMQNKFGMFCDVTRTFIVGDPPHELMERYIDLLKIYHCIQKQCQIGHTFSDLYTQVLELVRSLDYANNFMGLAPDCQPFIGHNIGAWVDEYPAISKNSHVTIQENMIFAIEPKFYFSDGYSPGIESTFVQTLEGPKSLDSLAESLIVL